MKLSLFILFLLCTTMIVRAAPTFEEWVKDGKKIPEGMIFTGGSPWFNESTGKNRSPEEVYKMVFGKDAGPGKKSTVPTFKEWIKGGKKIPEGMMFAGGSPWFNESTGKNRSPEEVYKIIFRRDAGPGKKSTVPTFKEWIKGGKKIPERMIFTGGSPWFNESTGKNRSPEEVYKMIFKTSLPARDREIESIRNEIARLKEFMTRARFTPEGLAKHKAKIKILEELLAAKLNTP